MILLGGLLLLLICEAVSAYLLRKQLSTVRGKGNPQTRMVPHIFAHFVPSALYPDMSLDGFRLTRLSAPGRVVPPQSPENSPAVYLAGDCTVFEDHLPVAETFAYQLDAALEGRCRVLNAGAGHYTALHAYHRLVGDVVRGYRPEFVLLFSAANDVLSVIHHKEGQVSPDHMHLYRPWISYAEVHRRLGRIPSFTLRWAFSWFLFGRGRISWERLAERISPVYAQGRSVAVARSLFDPSGFVRCLKLFLGTCQGIGAELILTTYPYQTEDMLEEPRRTYAWGMDRLNEEIRKFALVESIPLLDLARDLTWDSRELSNKWHYTVLGNRKRAAWVASTLTHVLEQAKDLAHEPSR